MAQTNVNIRMDAGLKNQFETFCNQVGLTMSAAFNVFACAVVHQQKIPFEIAASAAPRSESPATTPPEPPRPAEPGRLPPQDVPAAE